MLKQIAAAINFPFMERDAVTQQLLQRIQSKLPQGMTENDEGFAVACSKAEQQINDEGDVAIVNLSKMLTAAPPERVYKIKPTLKGERIKVAAANGVRYSFGPVWNDSVKRGKGVALVAANREKLNHQALMYGISAPEAMEIGDLAAAIAAKL